MNDTPDEEPEKRRDAVLRRMLSTPPKTKKPSDSRRKSPAPEQDKPKALKNKRV